MVFISILEKNTLFRSSDALGNDLICYPVTKMECVLGLEDYIDKLLLESAYLDLILIHNLNESVSNQIITIKDSYGEIVTSEVFGFSIPKRFYLSPNSLYSVEFQDFDGCFTLSPIEFSTGDEKTSVEITAEYIKDICYYDLTLVCSPTSTDVSLANIVVKTIDGEIVFEGAYGSTTPKRIELKTSTEYVVTFSLENWSLGTLYHTFITTDIAKGVRTHWNAFYKLYGFKIDEDDSDPFTRVHYINDNANFSPVTVNVDGDGSANEGDWASFIEALATPLKINNSGAILVELNRTDTSKSIAGVVQTYADYQQAMVRFRKLWCRKSNDDKTFEYAFVEFPGSACWTWANGEETRADYIYYPMFKGSLNTITGAMKSVPYVTPTVSTTTQEEMDACALNGDGWYPRTHIMHNFLEEMTWLLGKSTDCQTTFGQGCCSGDVLIDTGSTIESGAFWGSSDATKDVKFLYIEGLWGNRFDRTVGMHCNVEELYDVWVKPYPPFNLTADGYTKQPYKTPTSGGYAGSLSISDIGNNFNSTSGSSTTRYTDYLGVSSTLSIRQPVVGGRVGDGDRAGVSYWSYDSAGASVGASPHYIPPPTD